MVHFAAAMFVLTLIAFFFGMVGFAGLSPEIGGLFGILAVMFLMVAVRLDDSKLTGSRPAPTEDAAMFGPHIRMRMVPVALSNARSESRAMDN